LDGPEDGYFVLNSEKVMKKLNEIVDGMGKRDVVFFYFSGHEGRSESKPRFMNNTQYIDRMSMPAKDYPITGKLFI
jgi:hypothetical protein